MLFPRVVRLDESDERVYETAAAPGEWAVPGAFVFLEVDIDQASGKVREAFRHGFLGPGSRRRSRRLRRSTRAWRRRSRAA